MIATAHGDVRVTAELVPVFSLSFRLRKPQTIEPFSAELPDQRGKLPADVVPYATDVGPAKVVAGARFIRLDLADPSRSSAALELLVALCRARRSRGVFR